MRILCAVLMCLITATAYAEDEVTPTDGSDKPFNFTDRGRRDPFTFARAPRDPPLSIVQSDQVDPANPEDLPRFAGMYEKAEQEFLDGDYLAAMKHCANTLDAINALKPKAALVFASLRVELQRLDRAATLQQERLRAEQAFATLALRVSGVVAREKHSVAVVNAQVMHAGDCVSGGNESVTVESVRPECVVFRFRGFLMEAVLDTDAKR
jgi:hypothetical protein